MPQTLFDEGADTRRDAPTLVYVGVFLLGLIPFSGIIIAPLAARRWPRSGWRWGLAATAFLALAYFFINARRAGVLAGAVATLTSPVLLALVTASCVLSAWAARRALKDE